MSSRTARRGQPPGPFLIVSVHDVAPATAGASRRWAAAMAELGIPLTFLVVPGPWRGARFGDVGDDDLDLAAWLRSRQRLGDEISVHGWCHQADVPGAAPRRLVGSIVARGCAELWALDRPTTAQRTADGIGVLNRHGLAVTGATPPGWLASTAARAGLADAGMQYVTDHTGMTDLATGRRWRAPAVCHRPAAEVPETNWLEQLGRRAVSSTVGFVAAGWSVRLGLHPGDLDRPGLQEAAVAAVQGCLDAGAVPTTYQVVLGRLRARV
jgi:predicted deacetylase